MISTHGKKDMEIGSPSLQPLPMLKKDENISFCITHNHVSFKMILILCVKLGPN